MNDADDQEVRESTPESDDARAAMLRELRSELAAAQEARDALEIRLAQLTKGVQIVADQPHDVRGSALVRALGTYIDQVEARAAHAADERWTAAMASADWDGGVFHHEGRIYPWPKGFVPDCPATWAPRVGAALDRALDEVLAAVLERTASGVTHVLDVTEAVEAVRRRRSEFAVRRDLGTPKDPPAVPR